MRSFPTLRDAEIAYSQLEQRVAMLEKGLSGKQRIGTGSPVPQPKALFSPGQTPAPPFDIDSANDNNKIIHYLEHSFLSFVNVYKDLSVYPQIWILEDPQRLNVGWNLGIDDGSPNKDLLISKSPPTFDPVRALFRLRYNPAVPEAWVYTEANIEPVNTVTHDIGAAGKLYRKGYFRDLQVPTTTPPAIGDVLTALDALGNVGWAAGGGGAATNNYKEATDTLNLNLTTSYQDVPGASIVLDQDGYWFIIGQFNFFKDNDDTLLAGIINYNGSGVSIGYTGELSGSAMEYYSTVTIFKIVQVTSQPRVARLQALKTSGTGLSQTISSTCRISAIYLKA